MEIEFKPVKPETRLAHLDAIGDHEEIINRGKNQARLIILVLIAAGTIGIYFLWQNYETKIQKILKQERNNAN